MVVDTEEGVVDMLGGWDTEGGDGEAVEGEDVLRVNMAMGGTEGPDGDGILGMETGAGAVMEVGVLSTRLLCTITVLVIMMMPMITICKICIITDIIKKEKL